MFPFLDFFGKQKVSLRTGVTKSYQWRIKQLDRLERMLKENKYAFCNAVSNDFELSAIEPACDISAPIAIIEFTRYQLREWVAPGEEPMKTTTEPVELSLGNGFFSGSLTLLFNPVIRSISSGNPVVLKADEYTPATNAILGLLLPRYFEPSDFSITSTKSLY